MWLNAGAGSGLCCLKCESISCKLNICCLVQLLNLFTRKKYRIPDKHFVYFTSQLQFLIGMFAESVQYYNLEVEKGGKWGRERRGSGVAE